MRRKMARDGGSYSNVKLLALSHKIFLNIIATYGRSLYALGKIGLFCGGRVLIALGIVRV